MKDDRNKIKSGKILKRVIHSEAEMHLFISSLLNGVSSISNKTEFPFEIETEFMVKSLK